MSSIDQKLRTLIRADGRKLAVLARLAEIPRMSLWSWFTGRQSKLDVVHAEKIHRVITGKGFG